MSECKRCGGEGRVGIAVNNSFGSHDIQWYDCPECHPDGDTALKADNATLREQLEFALHEKAELERVVVDLRDNYELLKAYHRSEVIKRQERCVALERAIREAMEALIESIDADDDIVYRTLPEEIDAVYEILRKAVE